MQVREINELNQHNQLFPLSTERSFLFLIDPVVFAWSVDQLMGRYPWNSPYAFAMNRLVDGIELEGKEWHSSGKFFDYMTGKYQINYDIKVKVINDSKLISNIDEYTKESIFSSVEKIFLN